MPHHTQKPLPAIQNNLDTTGDLFVPLYLPHLTRCSQHESSRCTVVARSKISCRTVAAKSGVERWRCIQRRILVINRWLSLSVAARLSLVRRHKSWRTSFLMLGVPERRLLSTSSVIRPWRQSHSWIWVFIVCMSKYSSTNFKKMVTLPGTCHQD